MLHGSHGVVIQITERAFAGYLPDGHCISGTISGDACRGTLQSFREVGSGVLGIEPCK
jgi:hypothetical protein